ncbi:ankyrin repeat family protein [Orientia tsutsugamushi str. UT144]|uniref:Ankyrin repeat family protein n=1 Tax=Orientia tsutsugamushi str. UT144 TaxID=1441384 RepID=A0A0F3RHZ9_ORITS|nr:ankyrin repeat domain-containing protein [Orientia tsutsugamushi]KJW06070.1 ankyrin repeat family protein [Orientia tsutsugamushi str. UT144]
MKYLSWVHDLYSTTVHTLENFLSENIDSENTDSHSQDAIDLESAIISDDIDFVKNLLAEDNTIINSHYKLALLHYAVICNKIEIVKIILMHHSDISLLDSRGQNAFHHASINGHTDLINFISQRYPDYLNVRDKSELTGLHYASANGHIDAINLILQHNPYINLQDHLKRNTTSDSFEEHSDSILINLILQHNPYINLQDHLKRNTTSDSFEEHSDSILINLLWKHNPDIRNLQNYLVGNTNIYEAMPTTDEFEMHINNYGIQEYYYQYPKVVVKLLIAHVLKTKHFSQDINSSDVNSEIFIQNIEFIQNSQNLNMEFIQNSQNLSILAQKCEQEIQKMQDIKIGSSDKTIYSMYLLPNNTNVLARYAIILRF